MNTSVHIKTAEARTVLVSIFLLIFGLLLSVCLTSQEQARKTGSSAKKRVGLLPVDSPPVGSGRQKANRVQKRLRHELNQQELSTKTTWTVVEPEEMGFWRRMLRQHSTEEPEPVTGQVAGVDLVLVPRLVRLAGEYYLQLRALETVSGERIFRKRKALSEQGTAASLVNQLGQAISEQPRPPEHPIYVTFPAPVDRQRAHEPTWRSNALRRRLSSILNDHPRIRVVNPELSTILTETEWPDRIPIEHPRPVSGPVRDPVRLTGQFSVEAPSEKQETTGSYRMNFTVRYGNKHENIRLHGPLDRGPRLQATLAKRILDAMAKWFDVDLPEPKPDRHDRRYWSVWQILNREVEIQTSDSGTGILENAEHFTDLNQEQLKHFLQALDQDTSVSVETSPFYPVHETLNAFLLEEDLPEDHPVYNFVDHYPTSGATRKFVSENYPLLAMKYMSADAWNQLEPLKKKVVVRYARHLARKLMWEGVGWNDKFPEMLVRAGEGRLALDAIVSYLWSNRQYGWTYFYHVLAPALEQGKMDLAYDAYRLQLKLFPGYTGNRFINDEQIEKMKRDPDHNWEHLLDQLKEKQEENRFADRKTEEPAEYSTFVDPENVELLSVTYETDRGRILSVTGQKDDLWAVVRNEDHVYLWEAGTSKYTSITGLPEIEPPVRNTDANGTPSIVEFRGAIYVATGPEGLWKINMNTGQADRVTEGLSERANVYVVETHGGSLYAGGVTTRGNSKGFLLRWNRMGRTPERYTPPPDAGGIGYLDTPAENQWWFYHHRTGTVSRFLPETGHWTSSFRAKEYRFNPSIFSATDTFALFSERGYDPFYTVTEKTGNEMKPVIYPPPDHGDASYELRKHRWFFPGRHSLKSHRIVPLAGLPADAISHNRRIFLLDRSGGLTITDDGNRFTHPIQTEGKTGLHDAGDRLLVLGKHSILVILYDHLFPSIDRKDPRTRSGDLHDRTVDHIQSWLDRQSAWKKSAYFRELRYFERAAEALLNAPEVTLNDRTTGWIALLLEKAGRTERASALLRKHGLTVNESSRVPKNKFHFERLLESNRWNRIISDIRSIWKRQPDLYAREVYEANLHRAYLDALERVLNEQTFVERMWSMLYGDLPDVRGGWNQNIVMRINANRLRAEAGRRLIWQLIGKRQFSTILQHPLLGPGSWEMSRAGKEWNLYLYAGQPQRALQEVESEEDRTKAYLYSGQYEEAAGRTPKEHNGGLESYLKANLLAGNWTAFEDAKQQAAADDRDELSQFARRISLLHRSPGAFDVWLDGFRAEFYDHPNRAIDAYSQCAENFPGTLAAAESAFRLGELMLLDRNQPADASRWFRASGNQFRSLLDPAEHDPTASYARYRLGQIAYLVNDDRDTAKHHWSEGKTGQGYGRDLCRQALHSLNSKQPVVGAGTERNPKRKRVVNVDLRSMKLYVHLKKPYMYKNVHGTIRAPIGTPSILFDWIDDKYSEWSSLYLYDMFNDLRPGFAMIHVRTPDDRDTVWCRLHRN